MKLKILKISTITFLTLLLFSYIFNVNCPQTEIFTGDSLFLFLRKLLYFTIGVVIWRLGYTIFLKSIKQQQILKKYFILLTIIASFPLVKSIWVNGFSSDRELIESICNKSSDDGMFCSIDRLTFDEYDYIQKKSGWIPEIPSHSENIDVGYFRDDFLGDYFFSIWLELPDRPAFDSIQFPHLKKAQIVENDLDDLDNLYERDEILEDKIRAGANIYYYNSSSD